ncbi:MAG TPA: fumarylacetoacetate hydrolase family protein [Terriglobales bacterium]|nr:fumarylacetoacetate hydrolase family protein [Terriglobales bacterium]
MKTCHFLHAGQPTYGLIEPVAGREAITRVFAHRTAESGPPDEDAPTQKVQPVPLLEVKLLAPVRPSKIVCVGRNYAAHAQELGNEVPSEILIFLKPPSSVIGPGETIIRPRLSERVDHEGELAVIIGKTCHKLADDQDVREFIHGYTCLNDVTARDLQKTDGQWTRAKGFDTFCPMGPLVTDEIDPWAGVTVECRVNGEVKQQSDTTQFIFPLDQIIRYIATVMTLAPGDLIATGTPAGISPLKAGDVVEVSCGGVGTLSNPVADES